MSKLIFVCHKHKKNESTDIEKICNNIQPDNLNVNKARVINNEGTTFGIFNPNDTNLINGESVCLGYVDSDSWYKVGNEDIDGNFAIIRSDSNYVEAITDVVATRTLWYVHEEDYLIISTSQRMIVSYLESYSANKEVFSWMLSTGSLGFNNSWDKRIKCIPNDSILTLDRQTWELNVSSNEIKFSTVKSTYSSHKKKLQTAINNSIRSIDIDFSKWVLPLSGGYDSRGILMNLNDKEKVKTITWGLESSLQENLSDANIAKRISNKLGLDHRYYHTDFSGESIEVIFNRFLEIGEGRSDNIGGYLDGFNIWKLLFEKNVTGIIRGDEGFGWLPVRTEKEAMRKNGISYLKDYENLKPFLKDFPENKLPKELLRQEHESISTWRDRLYHSFRLPTVLAALNDLKLTHVELINPLLTKKVIIASRTLPDNLRTNKKLFKEIVDSYGLDIPYAKHGSNMDLQTILKQEDVVNEIKVELVTSDLLPKALLEFIIKNMITVNNNKKSSSKKEKLIRNLKISTPVYLQDILKSKIPRNIDVNLLGFRAYMIIKMNKILIEDSKLLK